MSRFSTLLLVLVLTAGMAAADTFTFFGEDLGLGESTKLPSWPNAAAAQAAFLSNLVGVGIETLESYASGTSAPLAISFPGAGTATLQGSGYINSQPTGTNGFGRYPISGSNYWETTQSFYIDFTAPVAAFGFYGVDIGDFGGQVTLTLTSGATKTLTIPNTVNGNGGSVLYYGVIETNPADVFTRVTFGNTAAGTDYFGFDDFTIGSLQQVSVPEPASWLFLGMMALGTLGIYRKKQA